MNDRLALMAAIVANPDEDTPRLALADWLQEHGDDHDRARAEHIRLQIECDRFPYGDKRRTKFEKKFIPIQEEHGAAWLGPLLKLCGRPLSYDHIFRRGLLFWWYTPTRTFLQKSTQAALLEWLPRVGTNCLILNDKSTREPEVAASPVLDWIPDFEWADSKMDDGSLAALAKSPHFTRLSSFELSACKVTDAGLRTFAKTATMPNLRHFALTETLRLSKYTAAGVLAVVTSPRFPKLCDLDLESSQTKTLDHAELFADAGVNKLTRVRLGWGSEAGPAFRCPHLTNLAKLSVNSGTVTDADAEALLANTSMANLAELEMRNMNARRPRLSRAVEKRLKARFGKALSLDYSQDATG